MASTMELLKKTFFVNSVTIMGDSLSRTARMESYGTVTPNSPFFQGTRMDVHVLNDGFKSIMKGVQEVCIHIVTSPEKGLNKIDDAKKQKPIPILINPIIQSVI